MPIYEYRCTSCGDVFEKIQRFSDPPLASCESCHGAVEKLPSRAAFHLRGGGWYASGYTKSADGPATESGTKKADGGAETPATSPRSDSKPEGGGCGASCACH